MSAVRPIRIGVVGTGGWARGFWSEGITSPDVEIVACCDLDPARAAQFAERYGGEVLPSYEALLADPRVEAVANFTPNTRHAATTKLAAAAGKHVFVEKPIANTCEEGAEMVRACRQAGVALMVGHSTRYQAVHRLVNHYLEEGTLGTLAMVEANISHGGGARLGEGEWRWHWEEAPGGPLMQLSIHAYDTLHYHFGPTRRVTAFSKRDLLPSEIEDVFLTLLEFESGLLAYVGTNYLAPAISFFHIFGRDGNLYAERESLTHVRPTDPWSAESTQVEIPKGSATAAEMTEFARAIRTGAPPETDGRAGLLALGVVWAALQSVQQNRPIEVREALGPAAALLDE